MSAPKLTGRVSRSSVKKFFYAVGRGKKIGIYNSCPERMQTLCTFFALKKQEDMLNSGDLWLECKAQVNKYPNAAFKKFIYRYDAENFVNFWKNCTLPMFKIKEITDSTEKPIKNKNYKAPFYFDKDDYVKVYTDGSVRNDYQKAGLGVWFGENHPLNLSKAVKGIPTSNLAEIKAAHSAIQVASQAGVKKLKILTDSGYLLNSITKWIHKWKKNGWKSSMGKPIKHKKELQDLFHETNQIKVRWEKVIAHAGVRGNESAHQLARNGFRENQEVEPKENKKVSLKKA